MPTFTGFDSDHLSKTILEAARVLIASSRLADNHQEHTRAALQIKEVTPDGVLVAHWVITIEHRPIDDHTTDHTTH